MTNLIDSCKELLKSCIDAWSQAQNSFLHNITIKSIFATITWRFMIIIDYVPPLYRGILGILILDWITGYAAARYTNTVNSKKARLGFWKIVLVMVILGVFLIIGKFIEEILVLSNILQIYIIYNELISVLENAEKCDINYFSFLIKKLKGVKERLEEDAIHKKPNDKNNI